MYENIGIIALSGFKDRAQSVNNFVCELTKEPRNYLIDVSSPRFSNGEGKIQINESITNKDIYIIDDVGNYTCTYKMYNFENHMSPDDHYLDIVRTVSALGGKANKITLIMPLMYSSRQHRKKGRESLDCAMALRNLEAIGINNIITFDVHDPEIQNTIPTGSFDSFFPIYSILKKFISKKETEIDKEKLIVISPDTGAMERSRKYASLLNLNLGLYYKRRDYTKIVNGKNPILQHEYIGPDVDGKNLIIVDDMLASGGSIIDICENMHSRGCKNIYVFVTFAFFTEGYEKFDELFKLGKISKVYATNASFIPDELRNKEWFEEIDLTKFIAKIIIATNGNQSMGELITSNDKILKLLETIKK